MMKGGDELESVALIGMAREGHISICLILRLQFITFAN